MYVVIYLILSLVSGLNGLGIYGFENGHRNHVKKMARRHLNASDVKEKWIEQPLDHFDTNEKRKWKMRYFENLQFWKPNGTIYLYIGNDFEAAPSNINYGLLYELAGETNGAMFGSEHRYYGKSIPLDTTDTASLKYLSARQALADLSYLLETIKSSPQFATSTESKIAVIGCHYGGNLAAWMRLFYPKLVQAALASSAPVLAQTNFYEYLEKVSDVYQRLGLKGCHEKIKEIFERYDHLLKSAEGIKQLKAEFHMCNDTDMTNNENKQIFFMLRTYYFSQALGTGWPADIPNLCKEVMNTSSTSTSHLLSLIKSDKHIQRLWRKDGTCYDGSFKAFIRNWILSDTDVYMSYYQSCTEFGYFETSSSKKQPFTNNVHLDIFYKTCIELFGPEFDGKRVNKGVDFTNKLYGGKTPNVTRVVFVNGDMNPWSTLGVTRNLSSDAPAIVIPTTDGCLDLEGQYEYDPVEIKNARKQEKALIKKWLGISG